MISISPPQSFVVADLPFEIWAKILRIGVDNGVLNYRDLCSVSIVGRTLNHVATLSSLWKLLFEKDFPQFSNNTRVSAGTLLNFRTIYKQRFEKIKDSRLAAHKRQVLRLQSRGAVLEKDCKALEKQVHSEKRRLLAIQSELRDLEQARSTSYPSYKWRH